MLLGARRWSRLLIAWIAASTSPAIAQTVESEGPRDPVVPLESRDDVAGTGSLRYQLGFYNHGDNGDGNPFLDEALTVIEPILVFDYNVSDRFGYTTTVSYDHVTSASIDRLSNFPDQSGASGDNYIGADVALRYEANERLELGTHFGFSTEYDYSSLSLGVAATHAPLNTNAKVSYSLDAFFDTLDIIRFDGTEDEGSDNRTSVSGTVNWYQVWSPTLHGELGATLALQSGFLETPYNAVVIEDASLPPNPNLDNMARGREITEELPDSRARGAFYGRLRGSLGEGRAWELNGRLYSDSWSVNSLTLEPRYYRTLIPDQLDLRLRYRLYVQSASKYFEESFIVEDEFRTQDSDLGDYNTHTLGFKLTWKKSQRHWLDLAFDYAIRSDGLDHIFGAVGWTWKF